MSELPLAPVDRLIRKAGIDRVSEGASTALRDVLEAIAIDLSKEASELSRHAGRKTVTAEDVRLASKRMMRLTGSG